MLHLPGQNLGLYLMRTGLGEEDRLTKLNPFSHPPLPVSFHPAPAVPLQS